MIQRSPRSMRIHRDQYYLLSLVSHTLSLKNPRKVMSKRFFNSPHLEYS